MSAAFSAVFHRVRPARLGLAALVLFAGLLPWNTHAQLPPAPVLDANVSLDARNQPDIATRLTAADNALAAGLTLLAEGFYGEVASLAKQDAATYQRARLGVASCLLERSDFSRAQAVLEPLPESPARQIRLAIALVAQGKALEATSLLGKTPVPSLPAGELPWYHAALGMIALSTNDSVGAVKAFTQARESLPEESQQHQRQHMRMLEYLAELRLGNATEERASQLKKEATQYENNPAGHLYVMQLAMALDQLKRPAQAAAELERLTLLTPEQRDERDLLLGIILTPATEEARKKTFYEVLKNKASPDLQKIALHSLAAAVDATVGNDSRVRMANEIFRTLTELAAGTPDSRTLDTLNLVRAQIMAMVSAWDKAESAANDLLEKTPQSPLRADALRILASTAFQNKNYRRTANYLQQLRKLSPPADQPRIGRVAADCLFLAGQHQPAAAAYAEVLPQLTLPVDRGAALFLQVCSELESGNAAAAKQAIATARQVDPASLKSCEWALINWLRKNQGTAEALARVRQNLATLPESDTAFRLRFLWQEALLCFDAKNYAAVLEVTGQISQHLRNLPANAPAELQKNTPAMLSQTELLRARAVLASRQLAEAQTSLAQLRRQYPHEAATAASYLVEGRDWAARNEYVKARDAFRTPYQLYQSNRVQYAEYADYAPIGLFEAAEQYAKLGEAGGGREFYAEANQRFAEFAQNFPQHPLIVQARLRQADLFRMQGQFDDAIQIYEALIREQPDNADRWRAELGRADCLFAKAMSASAGADQAVNRGLERAILAYERLFTLPDKPADLKAEAGFKWGSALKLRQPDATTGGRTAAIIASESKDAHWLVVNQLLLNRPVAETLGTGRWWVTRSLFEVAAYFEATQNNEEARAIYRHLLDYNREVQNTPQRVLPGQEEAKRKLATLPFGNQDSSLSTTP